MYIICQMYDWNKYIDIIRITYFREIFSFPLAISIPDKIRNRVKSQTRIRIPATGSAAPCRSNFLFPLYIQGICSFDLFLINQKPLPSHKPWPSQSEPAPSKKCKAKNYFKKRTLFYISLCLSVQRQVSSVYHFSLCLSCCQHFLVILLFCLECRILSSISVCSVRRIVCSSLFLSPCFIDSLPQGNFFLYVLIVGVTFS